LFIVTILIVAVTIVHLEPIRKVSGCPTSVGKIPPLKRDVQNFPDRYLASNGRENSGVIEAWRAFRGNLRRTGNIDGKPGPQSANLLWVFKNDNVNADFSSSPAVVGNRIYIGCALAGVFSNSGLVYCIDAQSAEIIWEYETGKQIFSSPAVVNNKVYIGEGLHWDEDSNLYCLDASDGKLLWSFQTASHVESSPTFMDGKIYFGAGEDGVFCVDADTGEKIWHFSGEHVDNSPIAEEDSVYFGTGYGNERIYCLDSQSGEEKWVVDVDYPVWGSPALDDGKIYLGIGNGNFLESDNEPGGAAICFDAKSGKSLWRYETEDSVITAIALDSGEAYFGSRDGNLYCLDAKAGALKWKKDLHISIVSSPAVVKNGVYFGCDDGRIYCLDRNDGSIKWSFDTDEQTGGCRIISSPAVANGRLYIGSCSQYLFCMGL
ncbi:MAG: PQQ-binding-like beta-propeller repeat protein, partial [Candidatus Poribacteria bacterium]